MINIKKTSLYFLLVILILILFYINYIKFFDTKNDNNNDNYESNSVITKETEITNYFISDEININNLKIIEKNDNKYLAFNIVSINEETNISKLNIVLIYDGSVVYESEFDLEEEENKENIYTELILPDFDYDPSELTVNFSTIKISTANSESFQVQAG